MPRNFEFRSFRPNPLDGLSTQGLRVHSYLKRDMRWLAVAAVVACCTVSPGCGDDEDAGAAEEIDTGRGGRGPALDGGAGDVDAGVVRPGTDAGDNGGSDAARPPVDVGSDVAPADTSPDAPAPDAASPDAARPDAGGGELPTEVRAAREAASAATEAAVTTYCDCYRDGAPYNGNDAACRDELDGLAIPALPCDDALGAEFPDDAVAFYACRQTVAGEMDACFGGCGGRIGAVTGCVVTAATSAVACGTPRSAAFVAAYEACHP